MSACPAPGQCPCGTATFQCPTLKCSSFGAARAFPGECSDPKFLLEMPLWIKAGWHSLSSGPWHSPGTDGLEGSRALGAQGQHRDFLFPRNQEILPQQPRGRGQGAPAAPGSNPAVPLDVGTSLPSLWDRRCCSPFLSCSIPVMPCKLIFFPLAKLGKCLLSRSREGNGDDTGDMAQDTVASPCAQPRD